MLVIVVAVVWSTGDLGADGRDFLFADPFACRRADDTTDVLPSAKAEDTTDELQLYIHRGAFSCCSSFAVVVRDGKKGAFSCCSPFQGP